MMNTQNYSKEAIKNRMYRHAMNFWGVKKVENLDPLIKLMLEALSCEIFELSHEIESSQHRVLDKVASMLTPDTLASVQPSHGVCHALPRGMVRDTLRTSEGFYIDIPSDKEEKKVKLSFYPVRDTEMYAGDVCRIICNGDIYKMDSTMTKELSRRAPAELAGKFNHNIWIGLDFQEDIQKIKSLPLFFELPHRENRQLLYSLLAYSKWRMNEQLLTIQQGIEQKEESDDPESLFSICDIEKEIERDILTLYNNQFIRVSNPFSAEQITPSPLPTELKKYYPTKASENDKPLYWLRVEMPSNFTPDVLEELRVSMNAIVVQNKQLKHITTNVNELTAVVPLPAKTNEYFYAVKSVRDDRNREYTEIPYNSGVNKGVNNTYVIRRGGCERLNSRDVKEYLYRVLDLLQDRGAFVASLEKDTFSEEILEMDQLLNYMERTINNVKSATGSLSYLLVDLAEKTEILYVDYYATTCEQANNFPVGMHLKPISGTDIEPKSAYLLTTTRGGRGIPVSTNRFDIYKYALTTRDRIVTRSDIMSFFRKELGGYLEQVRIENGVMVSEKPQEGLVRSIDVHLTLKDCDEKDMQLVIEDLKIKLISRSLDRFNYRIFSHKA